MSTAPSPSSGMRPWPLRGFTWMPCNTQHNSVSACVIETESAKNKNEKKKQEQHTNTHLVHQSALSLERAVLVEGVIGEAPLVAHDDVLTAREPVCKLQNTENEIRKITDERKREKETRVLVFGAAQRLNDLFEVALLRANGENDLKHTTHKMNTRNYTQSDTPVRC